VIHLARVADIDITQGKPMDLLKLIFGLLLACVLFVACAPEPLTEMGEEVPAVESDGATSVPTMAEVREAIRSLEDRNEFELLRVASVGRLSRPRIRRTPRPRCTTTCDFRLPACTATS